MSRKIRLFIIECVDPMDLIQKRSEGRALEQICKIIGHEVSILTAYSRQDLDKFIDYISSIDVNHDSSPSRKMPLCIHIAAHGNSDGVAFGRDFINWQDLYVSLEPVIYDMGDYNGEVILSISACGAGNQKLIDVIEKNKEAEKVSRRRRTNKEVIPPEFIFVTKGSGGRNITYWDDSAVAWTIFYHQLSKLRSLEQTDVNEIIRDIRNATRTELISFEWDKEKERYFIR